MSKEFDSRFVALLEAERQRLAFGFSREQTGNPGPLSVRRPGDSHGGRFFDPSPEIARSKTGQASAEVAGRI